MTEFMTATFAVLFDFKTLGIFVAALFSGLIFGSVPGLSTLTLAAVMLPFSVYMETHDAIVFYGAMYIAGVYGGAATAILFNIPGSVENAPTALDGYPMTRRGEASRAVALAIVSSAVGGSISCVLMMLGTEPIARWATEAIGPPEKLAIIAFASAIIAGVGSASLPKKILSFGLGLLIGTIGTDPVGGMDRFAFGNHYIQSGINFSVLILGFFAITEIMVQGKAYVSQTGEVPKLVIKLRVFAEVWAMRIVVIRSTLIGFFVGVLPGAGAALAAFLSYSEAARWSKHPERFGQGEPEGVVASETANNAACGGAMIPLLALGLPGGAFTAVMLGVLELHDITPGPLLLTEKNLLVWMLYAAMFWGSLLILMLGVLESRIITKLLHIPFPLLATFVVVFCVIGSFSIRNSILDVWTMLAAGLIGYVLRGRGYVLASVVMGVILGQLGEEALYQTMQLIDYTPSELMGFPIAIVFFALTLAAFAFTFYRGYGRRQGSRTT